MNSRKLCISTSFVKRISFNLKKDMAFFEKDLLNPVPTKTSPVVFGVRAVAKPLQKAIKTKIGTTKAEVIVTADRMDAEYRRLFEFPSACKVSVKMITFTSPWGKGF